MSTRSQDMLVWLENFTSSNQSSILDKSITPLSLLGILVFSVGEKEFGLDFGGRVDSQIGFTEPWRQHMHCSRGVVERNIIFLCWCPDTGSQLHPPSSTTIPRGLYNDLPGCSESKPLKGKRLGVHFAWTNDARPEVTQNFKKSLRLLAELGCKVIPLPVHSKASQPSELTSNTTIG